MKVLARAFNFDLNKVHLLQGLIGNLRNHGICYLMHSTLNLLYIEYTFKKGQGRIEHFFDLSYFKFQKEDWACCSRKVVTWLLDKVRERLWKKMTMVLNWYWLSNRKQKNVLFGLWPQGGGMIFVLGSVELWGPRHAHVALGVMEWGTSSVVWSVET